MTDPTPLFSLMTVTLNNLEGLKATAESVLGQRCTDYEWIVIDGGSDDGSVEYLKTLERADWTSENDDGIYDAMNKGMARSRGGYLLFLNAGDCFADDAVLEKIAGLAENAPDFIYGDSVEGGHYKAARMAGSAMRGMFTHHQAMFYRRSSIGALRYDLRYSIAADYDFTLRFLKDNSRAVYAPFPICDFEQGGVSQRQFRQGRKEQFIIRKRAGVSHFQNAMIFARQSVAMYLRRLCPDFYWRLRSSCNRRRD